MPLVEWQGSLQGLTFGTGTNYRIGQANLGGLGTTYKNLDVNLTGGDGSYPGPTRKASRLITIPFVVLGSSPSDAMDNYELLDAAFSDPGSDVTLELYLPGKHFTVDGRPRGTDEDLRRLKVGRIDCIATFLAHTPTMTAV